MGGKKQKCFGKDVFERMNFLYQAGTLMAGNNKALSCYYGQLCKSIGKKAVLRIEPNLHRTMCKRCGNILKPSKSAELSISDENPKMCVITCNVCGKCRRFPINPNYNLWFDNPQSVVEEIRYDGESDENQKN
ncbi:Ribonuclease P protein subunit p21 [Pseudolycoriella hygida]|uniref:Ribonuclease P protein subunit p21 n=1 Tax=Pseudolycoriella hygida TaxID=35572 RepID=A0A9Q0RVI3_9DIPT|nr:Ribonuclease P protein subunit p21 [Pseudolycoriella hygida]